MKLICRRCHKVKDVIGPYCATCSAFLRADEKRRRPVGSSEAPTLPPEADADAVSKAQAALDAAPGPAVAAVGAKTTEALAGIVGDGIADDAPAIRATLPPAAAAAPETIEHAKLSTAVVPAVVFPVIDD